MFLFCVLVVTFADLGQLHQKKAKLLLLADICAGEKRFRWLCKILCGLVVARMHMCEYV